MMDYKFQPDDACDFAWIVEFCQRKCYSQEDFETSKGFGLLLGAMVNAYTGSTDNIRRCLANTSPSYLADFLEHHVTYDFELTKEMRGVVSRGFARFKECVYTHALMSEATDHFIKSSRYRA